MSSPDRTPAERVRRAIAQLAADRDQAWAALREARAGFEWLDRVCEAARAKGEGVTLDANDAVVAGMAARMILQELRLRARGYVEP